MRIVYQHGFEQFRKLGNVSSNVVVAELTRVSLEAEQQVEVSFKN